MATTYETLTTAESKSGGADYDMSLWYDSRWYKFGLITMLAVAIFWVWYQRTFAYSHGMDSMEPEFEKVWMGLWRVHMIVMPPFALVTWGWIWKTRDTKAQLDNLDPKLEIKRYFYWMMWPGVRLFGVYWGLPVIQQRKYDNPYIENEVNTLGTTTGGTSVTSP